MFDSDVVEVIDDNTIALRGSNEDFKRGVSDLLFAFKEVAGPSQWLSAKGFSNNEEFCIVIALGEKAEVLNRITIESFLNEERD